MQQIRSALSLFNGISGLHLALDKAQINVEQVYYSEIDKFANKVTEQRYPNDIALGDVTKWKEWDIDWSSVDLVSAGFPCQSWSVAGQQQGDKDERGMLFWTTLDIIKTVLEHNPKAKFLMENVKMKKDFEQYITHHTTEALGYVEKTLINSALVSAQNRNRYYWTNFEVTQPEDKGILLKDIIEDLPLNESMPDNVEFKQNYAQWDLNNKGNKSQDQRAFYINGKHGTLPANGGGSKVKVCGGEKTNTLTTVQKDNVVVLRPASIVGRRLNERGVRDDYNKDVAITQCLQVKHKNEKTGCLTTVDKDNVLSTEPPGRYPDIYNRCDVSYRKLTPIECERLQTVPDNWTECLSNTQRYKSLGNGWTIDVIVHILECAFK